MKRKLQNCAANVVVDCSLTDVQFGFDISLCAASKEGYSTKIKKKTSR